MMEPKGRSPFYPSQPVPVGLFVGRGAQIERIMQRGVAQTAQGKPTAAFIQGEYGIGKSSLARYILWRAEKQFKLVGMYATLGNASSLDDVGAALLRAAAEAAATQPTMAEKIQSWMATYIGEQSLFGLTLRIDALKREAPNVAGGPLPFLREVLKRAQPAGATGIFLVLDEINGMAANPKFAHFLKDLFDANALSHAPVPLLLMLCGTRERRAEIVRRHPPVDRIFDLIDIQPLSDGEMDAFFRQAFASVEMPVDRVALAFMRQYAAGFPKLMHLIGDYVFWLDDDGRVDEDDAVQGVAAAADDFGRKYIDNHVYRALQSEAYRSILGKLAVSGLDTLFEKKDVVKGLDPAESRKFNNFLQRMKKLGVIRNGELPGQYEFASRMVRLYIYLKESRR